MKKINLMPIIFAIAIFLFILDGLLAIFLKNIFISIFISLAFSAILAFSICKIIKYNIKKLEEFLDLCLKEDKINKDLKLIGEFDNIYSKLIILVKEFHKEREKIKEMSKEISQTIKEAMEALEKLAEGDFSVRLNENRKRNKFQKMFNKAIERVSKIIENIRLEVLELNRQIEILRKETKKAKESIEQISDSAQEVANAAADQSSKLQDISREVEETSNLAKNTEKLSKEGVELAIQVNNKADEGLKKVEHAVDAMNKISSVIEDLSKAIIELGEKSKKINEVTNLIRDIAKQTGLLALNASIEAARAGEVGKGFAVVASEIKGLAEEISRSIDNINKIIEEISAQVDKTVNLGTIGKQEVDKGVVAVDEVNKTFLEIKEGISQTLEKIKTIKESADNTIVNMEKALRDIQDIASIAEEFTATAEELSAITEEERKALNEIEKVIVELEKVSQSVRDNVMKIKTYKSITVDEAYKLLNNPDYVFLNVVPKVKYTGRIPNSLYIPINELKDRLNEIPKDKKIIVYCLKGFTSPAGYRILKEHGYDVVNMEGGLEAWMKKGYPVED